MFRSFALFELVAKCWLKRIYYFRSEPSYPAGVRFGSAEPKLGFTDI